MSSNHLESLIAGWLENKNMFVRRNIHVGPRPNGGFECEWDVVALDLKNRKILHYEPSMDPDSWATREERYKQKFNADKKYIPEIFASFMKIHPDWIEQYAVTSLRRHRVSDNSCFFQDLGGKNISCKQRVTGSIPAAPKDKGALPKRECPS